MSVRRRYLLECITFAPGSVSSPRRIKGVLRDVLQQTGLIGPPQELTRGQRNIPDLYRYVKGEWLTWRRAILGRVNAPQAERDWTYRLHVYREPKGLRTRRSLFVAKLRELGMIQEMRNHAPARVRTRPPTVEETLNATVERVRINRVTAERAVQQQATMPEPPQLTMGIRWNVEPQAGTWRTATGGRMGAVEGRMSGQAATNIPTQAPPTAPLPPQSLSEITAIYSEWRSNEPTFRSLDEDL